MYIFDDRLYDRQDQIKLLRLVAARCGAIAGRAAGAMQWTSGGARQKIIDRIVPGALSDRDAAWTADERAFIISMMTAPGDPCRVD